MRDLLNDLDAARHLSDPDPVKRAQKQMRAPVAKRFYTSVAVEQGAEGFEIRLDGKAVRTPANSIVALPTRQAAQLIADEFDAQIDTIDPVSMPVTRLVNTALVGVATEAGAVFEDILRFASSDLLFYRVDTPEELVHQQAEAWDPILVWVRDQLGAEFHLAQGITHVEQPRESISALAAHLGPRKEPLRLAALHLMTSIMGSALLAIAVDARFIDTETAWAAAHVDEFWNEAHWGVDSEAIARRNARKRDMLAAVALIEALDAGD